MKILVVILAETRAAEHTWTEFCKFLLEPFRTLAETDLAVCVGKSSSYSESNPFVQASKYQFLTEEPVDFASGYDEAEKYLNLLSPPSPSTPPAPHAWRKCLELGDHIMGGVVDHHYPQVGSAGILLYYRFILWRALQEHKLVEEYDWFVVTRSDYRYEVPHPHPILFQQSEIWIPEGEDYGGITDRHMVVSRENILASLNVLDRIILRPTETTEQLRGRHWNLEKYLAHHFTENGLLGAIRRFPRVMYAVRGAADKTRWSSGTYHDHLGFALKYQTEYNATEDTKRNKFRPEIGWAPWIALARTEQN